MCRGGAVIGEQTFISAKFKGARRNIRKLAERVSELNAA